MQRLNGELVIARVILIFIKVGWTFLDNRDILLLSDLDRTLNINGMLRIT